MGTAIDRTTKQIVAELNEECRQILDAIRSSPERDERNILGMQEAEIIILERMKARLEALPTEQ